MNIIGQKFGKLLVLEKTNEKAKNNGEYKYKCICDCGKKILVRGSNLKQGNSKSCGCSHSSSITKENHRLYIIYDNMKARCNNPKCVSYKNYGGRGIKVCKEWNKDFNVFVKWALENGYKDNLTLDRINNNGNYEPSNCRWATKIEQANNMRTNRFITYNNETKTIAQWSRILKISPQNLRYRINHWGVEKAFNK